MSPYVLLGIAVIFEVFADSMMKLSNGFTRKAPIIGIVIGYIVAFYLIAQTLEQLPLRSMDRPRHCAHCRGGHRILA